MEKEIEAYYEVVGYDEFWQVMHYTEDVDELFYAQEEAEEMKNSKKYAHIIIRKIESYEWE